VISLRGSLLAVLAAHVFCLTTGMAFSQSAASLSRMISVEGVTVTSNEGDTAGRMSGVRMRSGSLEIALESLALEPRSGALQAGRSGAGEVAFPDIDDPGSGRIRFSGFTIDDVRALPLFLLQAGCGADVAGVMVPVTVSLRDVTLLASRRMLPKGELPERIEIPDLKVTLRMDPAASCLSVEEITAKSITSHAINRASFFVAEFRGLRRTGSFGGILEVDLRGVSAMDPERNELMSLGLMRVRGRVDVDPARLAHALAGEEGALAKAVKIAELSNPEIEFSFRGLHLPIGKLLPEAERAELGLDASSVIHGEARASLAGAGDDVVLAADVNLPGLIRFLLDLQLQSPATAQTARPALPPGFDGVGAFLPLLGLDLKSAHLSVQDLGARVLFEGASGRSLEDDFVAGLAPLGPLAADLEGPLRTWMRDAFFLGASLDLSPAEPVGLLRLGFQAIMDRASLPAMLGLRTGGPDF